MEETLEFSEPGMLFGLANSEGNDVPPVSMLAYTGKDVNLAGYYWPVVFDLSETKIAKTVPLLWQHDPEIVLGHADNVEVLATRIKATGKISGANDRVTEIIASSKNGMKWQVSVGLKTKRLEFVDSQSTVKVNGRTFSGPLYVARDNVLREISILSLGADSDTEATIAASYYSGGTDVTFEEYVTKLGFDPSKLSAEQTTNLRANFDRLHATNPPTPTPTPNPPPVPPVNDPIVDMRAQMANERTRVETINSLASQYNNPQANNVSIAATAIREGWTADRTELAMLRASRPTVPVASSFNFIDGDRENTFRVLEAGLAITSKLPNLEKHFPEQVLNAASKKFRVGLSLQEFLFRAACINGFSGSPNVRDEGNLRDMLRAAFSTFDVPQLLSNQVNAQLLSGFNAVDQSWRLIARRRSVPDFKEVTNLQMTGGFTFEPVAPDGRIKHATLDEGNFTNKAKTYGKMFSITRVDIINDSLDAFAEVPRMLGRGGALGLVRAFWLEFLDNSTFFTSGNANVTTGALSITGLDNAVNVFAKMKTPDGEYAFLQPKYLVVPPNLLGTAQDLYKASDLVGGGSTVINSNRYRGMFPPITSPYMNDPDVPGSSTTAYYLVGDSEDVPMIEVVFLNGRETPYVEQAEADFSQLGVQMRGYFDWGVKKQNPRGAVRSTGV